MAEGKPVESARIDPAPGLSQQLVSIDVMVMLAPEFDGNIQPHRVRLVIDAQRLAKRLGCRDLQSRRDGRQPGYRLEGGSIVCTVMEAIKVG